MMKITCRRESLHLGLRFQNDEPITTGRHGSKQPALPQKQEVEGSQLNCKHKAESWKQGETNAGKAHLQRATNLLQQGHAS